MDYTKSQLDYIMETCECSQVEALEILDFCFSAVWVPAMLKAGNEARRKALIDQAAARYRNEELAGLPLAELERRAAG